VRNLPTEFIVRKNKIANPNAWIWLLELQADDSNNCFYLTNNNDCVEYGGFTYDPYDLEIGDLAFDLRGDLPEVRVTLSNVTQQIMAFVEAADGLVDKNITIRLTNIEAPFTDVYEEELRVIETEIDNTTIEFTASFLAFEAVGFPGLLFVKDFCRWEFTSVECGVPIGIVAGGEVCTKSLNGSFGCIFWGDREVANFLPREHPNRFGAFPSLPIGRVFEV